MKIFAIISLPRTGSTWLSLSLNSLPDVVCDYEVKYPIVDRPYVNMRSPIHKFLNEVPFHKIIQENLKGKICGSKIVLDLDSYAEKDISNILEKIDEDIPIIHLTRDNSEIALSIERGAFNVASNNSVNGIARSNQLLTAVTRNKVKMDNKKIDSTRLKICKRKFLGNRIKALKTTKILESALIKRGNYLHVDYNEINSKFAEICDFIGSSTTDKKIRKILKNPPTEKLGLLDQKSYSKIYTDLGLLGFLFNGWPFEIFFLRLLRFFAK